MRSPAQCVEQADLLEARAAECADPATRAHWLSLAGDWRDLAADVSPQATTARLLHQAVMASEDPITPDPTPTLDGVTAQDVEG